MKRVLYSVSPIGLGHATRASAVAEELKAHDVDVLFASGGNALEYLKGQGFAAEDAVSEPVPTVVNGEMKRASFWYLKYWRRYRRSKAAMTSLVGEFKPHLVVGDEEFAGVSVAMERDISHALVTDELELGFARSAPARAIEARALRWYRRILETASTVVIPDSGQDSGNRKHTGPIVRKVTEKNNEVRRGFSLPADGQMVLLSMSGSGIGGHLLERTVRAMERACIPGAFLAVSGNRGERITRQGVYDLGVVEDNQNLIAAADLVVSTAGKSTIDEAASAGTPIIALPIKNHAEQERNAAALGYVFGDIDRLDELLGKRIGRREAPREYHGAEKTFQLFASML